LWRLPVIVNWVQVDATSGEEKVRVEARVDLVADKPEVVEMTFTAAAASTCRGSSGTFAGPPH